MDPTTQQNQEEKDIPTEDENSNTESIKHLDEEETEEVNENVDDWDDEIFSYDSLDSMDSLNTIDFEESGYIMKPDPYVEEPDDCSLSSESIESSPNAYKDEQHWNGYKVKKRRKKSPLKDVTDNDTVTISSSSDDNETVN